jgi:hypothetical protein
LFSSCWKVEEGRRGLDEHYQCGGGKLSDFCGSTKHKCGKQRIMSYLIQSLYRVAAVLSNLQLGLPSSVWSSNSAIAWRHSAMYKPLLVSRREFQILCLVHLSDDLLSATWTVNNNGREELSFSDGASEKGKHLHSSMYVSSVFVSDG